MEKICCQSKQKIYKVFCGQLQGHGWVWLMMGANRGRRQAMLPTHFVSSTNYCRRLGWVLSEHAIVLAMADTIIPPVHPSTQRLTCAFWLPGCRLCLELPHRTYESTDSDRKRKWIVGSLRCCEVQSILTFLSSQVELQKISVLNLMIIPSISLTINRECKSAKELLLPQHEVD